MLYQNARPSERRTEKHAVNNLVPKAIPTTSLEGQHENNHHSEPRARAQLQLQQRRLELLDRRESNLVAEAWVGDQLDSLNCLPVDHSSPSTYVISSPKNIPTFYTDWATGSPNLSFCKKSSPQPRSEKAKARTHSTESPRVKHNFHENGSMGNTLYGNRLHRRDSVMGELHDDAAQSSKTMDALHDPRDDQETIRRNYNEFLGNTQRHSRMCSDDAREATEYENIFLEEKGSDCASRVSGCCSPTSERISVMSLN